MVQWDVHVRKPSLNKLECGQNTVDGLQELVTSCRVLSGASMKALPKDKLGKIDDYDKYAFLEPGSSNACLMELLAQPLLPISGIPFLARTR